MVYTPENNPYIPGDPYSYDLKWMVSDIKHMEERFGELDSQVQEATDQADRSKEEADRSAEKANDAANSAEAAADSESNAADSAEAAANSEAAAKDYADNIADPVSGIVSDWLAAHIDPDTGYVLDDTLTIQNAAADAKAAGDILRRAEFTIDGNIPAAQAGYLDQNGGIHTTGSNSSFIRVMTARGGDHFLFTGDFPSDQTWPLAFAVLSDNTITPLFAGSKTNYEFVLPANTVELRVWSDNSFGPSLTYIDSLRYILNEVAASTAEIESALDRVKFLVFGNIPAPQAGYLDQNGALHTGGNFTFIRVFNVEAGDHFIYSGGFALDTSWPMAFAVNSNNVATPLCTGPQTNLHLTMPADTVELRVWSDDTYTLKLEFIDSIEYQLSQLSVAQEPRRVVVDAAGNADFTDIQSAIDYLTANYDVLNVPCTVYIKNGVYNVSPASTSPYFAINKGSNKISIIGESRDGVIINCVCTASLQGIALNIGGKCVVENLTINNLADPSYDEQSILPGQHRPYCLHNDQTFNSLDVASGYYTVVRNCKLYSECDCPLGAGMQSYQTQRYENCEFIYAANAVIKHFGAAFIHGPGSPSYHDIGGLEMVDCVIRCMNTSQWALSVPDVSGSLSWSVIPQTYIRNVTYSAANIEAGLESRDSITPWSKGNTANKMNYGPI